MPSSNAIHLLRALLRQCAYLPDPAARTYFHRHILSRYRVYHPRSTQSPPHTAVSVPRPVPPSTRQNHLLRSARHTLTFLERANNGHLLSLLKVLSLTYGRSGKRRHQLLLPLLAPDTPSDHIAVASLSACIPGNSRNSDLSPQLSALLKSHHQQRHTDLVRPHIKQLQPQIPETNIWHRPLSQNRVRNIKKRWLSMVIDRILPPLPEAEWERLRRLANGESRWEGQVQRRATTKATPEASEDKILTTDFLNRPLQELSSSNIERSCKRPHHITQRYMQKLWGRIYRNCPVMKRDTTDKTWQVQWGTASRSPVPAQTRMVIPELDIFSGVDEKGRVVR